MQHLLNLILILFCILKSTFYSAFKHFHGHLRNLRILDTVSIGSIGPKGATGLIMDGTGKVLQ